MNSKRQLSDLQQRLAEFRDRRNWEVYHTPKNLALSVSIESAEIVELFQWKSDAEVEAALKNPEFKSKLASEIADTLIYLTLLSAAADIDPIESAFEKVSLNEVRFPAAKDEATEQ